MNAAVVTEQVHAPVQPQAQLATQQAQFAQQAQQQIQKEGQRKGPPRNASPSLQRRTPWSAAVEQPPSARGWAGQPTQAPVVQAPQRMMSARATMPPQQRQQPQRMHSARSPSAGPSVLAPSASGQTIQTREIVAMDATLATLPLPPEGFGQQLPPSASQPRMEVPTRVASDDMATVRGVIPPSPWGQRPATFDWCDSGRTGRNTAPSGTTRVPSCPPAPMAEKVMVKSESATSVIATSNELQEVKQMVKQLLDGQGNLGDKPKANASEPQEKASSLLASLSATNSQADLRRLLKQAQELPSPERPSDKVLNGYREKIAAMDRAEQEQAAQLESRREEEKRRDEAAKKEIARLERDLSEATKKQVEAKRKEEVSTKQLEASTKQIAEVIAESKTHQVQMSQLRQELDKKEKAYATLSSGLEQRLQREVEAHTNTRQELGVVQRQLQQLHTQESVAEKQTLQENRNLKQRVNEMHEANGHIVKKNVELEVELRKLASSRHGPSPSEYAEVARQRNFENTQNNAVLKAKVSEMRTVEKELRLQNDVLWQNLSPNKEPNVRRQLETFRATR